jgi:hypothetical protein
MPTNIGLAPRPRLWSVSLAPAIGAAAHATLAAAELLENAGNARQHPSRHERLPQHI